MKTFRASKLIKYALAGVLALGITLVPKKVDSYATGTMGDQSIHPLLVEKLAGFHLPPNGISFDMDEVKRGSINEDSADSAYVRAFNHFQHWQNGSGLPAHASLSEWATNSALQAGFPYGDHSWARVGDEYRQGKVERSFGHIFHLIDATVPAHSRLDLHPLYDALERWTDDHREEAMNLVNPRSIPSFNSITDLISDAAHFSGSNFYSDDTIDGTVTGLREVREGRRTYLVKEIDGRTVHVLRKGGGIFRRSFPDIVCMRDYFAILGTKAVEYGAAALDILSRENPCTPDCSTNVCGDNGCGGSCGSCDTGYVCDSGRCVESSGCNPASGCSDSGCVFYDDFSGSSLDTECKWRVDDGSPSVSGGNLHLTDHSTLVGRVEYSTCSSWDFETRTQFGSGYESGSGYERFLIVPDHLSLGGINERGIDFACNGPSSFITDVNAHAWNTFKVEVHDGQATLFVNGSERMTIPCSISNITPFLIDGLDRDGYGYDMDLTVDYVKETCR